MSRITEADLDSRPGFLSVGSRDIPARSRSRLPRLRVSVEGLRRGDTSTHRSPGFFRRL